MTRPMPKNKGTVIKFRRPRTFTAATTPLVEGVTPQSTQFSYEDVEATLKQYGQVVERSEEHASELQSLMRNSYAVFCLKKKTTRNSNKNNTGYHDTKEC